MRRLLTVVIATVAMIAAATTSATASTASTASNAPRYRHYVALGDSYTAGPLIPLQRLDPIGCLRSTGNYPSLLAAALRVPAFTDVSCSGADTHDLVAPQDVVLGPNPPQLDALRPDTDLVTLGIGGNDYGVFGSIIDTCPGLRPADPTGNPCEQHFTVDGVDTLKTKLGQTGENVTAVLGEIHDRAPDAEVLVIGYPRIAPASGTCPDTLPFADGDYPWLGSVEEALNAALEKAVADDGDATYVDTFGPSLGHDACAPAGWAWINGKDLKPWAAHYHPLFAGMQGIAALTHAALRD